MFQKILIVAMFMTAATYCFADTIPQITTSEVFYRDETQSVYIPPEYEAQTITQTEIIPTWPLVGSDADFMPECDGAPCPLDDGGVRISSKVGADLIVENNFGVNQNGYWSGGANMLHGRPAPFGFGACDDAAEMPLLTREMLEDDGGAILAASRANRKSFDCGKKRNGFEMIAVVGEEVQGSDIEESIAVAVVEEEYKDTKTAVVSENAWSVKPGETLRGALKRWCDVAGWDLVWTTPREYPIMASATFNGTFTDAASTLVRNFGRAMPVPYAKFYNGNRVLVISTTEE